MRLEENYISKNLSSLANVLRSPKKKRTKKQSNIISITKVLQANTKFVGGVQRFCVRVENFCEKTQSTEI